MRWTGPGHSILFKSKYLEATSNMQHGNPRQYHNMPASSQPANSPHHIISPTDCEKIILIWDTDQLASSCALKHEPGSQSRS